MTSIPGGKKLLILIGAFILGTALILLGTGIGDGSSKTDAAAAGAGVAVGLEAKLEEFLESMSGIDSARVFLTVEDGNSSVKDGVYVSGYYLNNESAGGDYIGIKGIAVICTDGDRPSVKSKITELLSAAFGISANKIKVAGIDESYRS